MTEKSGKRSIKMLNRANDKTRARFWNLVDKRGVNECWPWNGTTDRYGYGAFKLSTYFRAIASRFAFAIHHNAEPGAKHVCHRCDNPPCCNPAHLFLGDAKINAADKTAKGRGRGRFSEPRFKLNLGSLSQIEENQC